MTTERVPAGIIAVGGCLLRSTSCDNVGKIPVLILQDEKGGLVSETEAKSSYMRLTEKSELVQY